MKPPFASRSRDVDRSRERGVTMVLVAVVMVAILAMAALSIDIVALYVAREEAQRSADAAALAAARVLSITGVTGDPDNLQGGLPSTPWPTACALATQVAQSVAKQNSIGSAAPTGSATVTFLYNGTTYDCTAPGGTGFALNPQVQVKVVRQGLPVFFARIWGARSNSVSATATAEAYNSSNSGTVNASGMVPVNPRCVKPWILTNQDPSNGSNAFVNRGTGAIGNEGIKFNGAGAGVIGYRGIWGNACGPGPLCPSTLSPSGMVYVPALVSSPATGYPRCASADDFQTAIGGCDQTTQYACGQSGIAQADLSASRNAETDTAAECLIRQPGQDSLDMTVFPYQIQAGPSNPVVASGAISSSTSIVTVPIYDQTQAPGSLTGPNPTVTIVGFLQVFINQAYPNGNLDLTILNVAGCSNAATNPAVSGSSPVPIRLITPQ